MIVMVCGTAESEDLARKLVLLGRPVMALTATDEGLDVGESLGVVRRVGRLDREGMVSLFKSNGAEAVVDVSHPYAAQARANARAAALQAGAHYLAYMRPASLLEYEKLHRVADHEEAARLAFSFGKPVLLSTGSRNLVQYVRHARMTGLPVTARVLDNEESLEACRQAGLKENELICGRGPFSMEANLEHISNTGSGTLVTKDGGAAGGVHEKLTAAKETGIELIVVDRPGGVPGEAFSSLEELAEELKAILSLKEKQS